MDTISKDDLAKIVGQRLKELRKASTDLGQGDIALEIGVTKQAVNSYENGRRIPELPILMALAERYGCSMDYLLGLSDRINRFDSNLSEKEEVQNLFCSLEALADDEGDYLLSVFTEVTDSLSVHRPNPQRRKFIECFGELLANVAAYVDMSRELSLQLSQKADNGSLTAEDTAISLAKAQNFDNMAKIVTDIEKTGIEAVLAFSVKARKVLNGSSKLKRNPRADETIRAVEKMLDCQSTGE